MADSEQTGPVGSSAAATGMEKPAAKGDGSASFIDLPQELVDDIVAPTLPSTLELHCHEYGLPCARGENSDATICIIEPRGRWRDAIDLRALHSKFRSAVDDKLYKMIDTVEIDLTSHGNAGRVWESKTNAHIRESMSEKEWDAIVKTYNIQSFIVHMEFQHHDRIADGKTVRLVLGKPTDKWVAQAFDWKRNRDAKKRARARPVWNPVQQAERSLIEGAIECVLGVWTNEGPTASNLSRIQQCFALPSEELALRPWAQGEEARMIEDLEDEKKISRVELHWRRRSRMASVRRSSQNMDARRRAMFSSLAEMTYTWW